MSGKAHAVNKILCFACCDQSRGGIRKNDIAVRSVLAIEQRATQHFVNDLRVVFRVAAANRFQRRAAQPEILGHNGVSPHCSVSQLRDARFSGN